MAEKPQTRRPRVSFAGKHPQFEDKYRDLTAVDFKSFENPHEETFHNDFRQRAAALLDPAPQKGRDPLSIVRDAVAAYKNASRDDVVKEILLRSLPQHVVDSIAPRAEDSTPQQLAKAASAYFRSDGRLIPIVKTKTTKKESPIFVAAEAGYHSTPGGRDQSRDRGRSTSYCGNREPLNSVWDSEEKGVACCKACGKTSHAKNSKDRLRTLDKHPCKDTGGGVEKTVTCNMADCNKKFTFLCPPHSRASMYACSKCRANDEPWIPNDEEDDDIIKRRFGKEVALKKQLKTTRQSLSTNGYDLSIFRRQP